MSNTIVSIGICIITKKITMCKGHSQNDRKGLEITVPLKGPVKLIQRVKIAHSF